MKTFRVFLEEIENLEEKNVPTSPEKWARAKAAAKSKFAVYPSAYANGWASKKYKSMGGGWRSSNEEVEIEEVVQHDPWKQKHFGPHTVVSNRKMSDKEKADWEKHKEWRKGVEAALASDMKRINKEEIELDEATKIITDGGVMNVHHNGHHIGNIMKSPSNKKTPYKAYSKHWDMKKLYKSKKDAADWLVQTHNTAMKEEIELDETAAWQRSAGKNPEGGLNRKGIASYRAEHPGSKLSMAVTTKPSKLKKGSKAANRRKSFCARMSGMKKRLTSAKTAHDPNSRINKSLRKWNC